jgi:uncharacterized protein YdeI (YjbR/CyaY-like superfamily)
MPTAAIKLDLPVLAFESAAAWRRWLRSHHTSSAGVWLRFFKKGSGVPTVTYSEAVDEALCFGWIDSQVKRFDEQSYLQRFSPRRRRSLWSKINITRVEKLTAAKRMRAAGLKEVEAAKADGRWEREEHKGAGVLRDAQSRESLCRVLAARHREKARDPRSAHCALNRDVFTGRAGALTCPVS